MNVIKRIYNNLWPNGVDRFQSGDNYEGDVDVPTKQGRQTSDRTDVFEVTDLAGGSRAHHGNFHRPSTITLL